MAREAVEKQLEVMYWSPIIPGLPICRRSSQEPIVFLMEVGNVSIKKDDSPLKTR